MSDAHSEQDISERYRRLVENLRVECPRVIRDVQMLHLDARTPPWTCAGMILKCGERATVLASGRVHWSSAGHLFAGPRLHLWARVGDSEIFRLGSDTRTFAVSHPGPLQLCILHGKWALPDGTLATAPEAYASLAGGIDVVVIRWGDVSPEHGLALLAARAPYDPLIAAERARLASPRKLPQGFEPLWFVGYSDIFYEDEIEGAPVIALRADANSGIVRKPCQVPLQPDTFLEWTWRVNTLPSRVREDAFATHDYASIALEFDDGRDLAWNWSAALPERHHYACPIPRWTARETHMVVRSGVERLGDWVDERCDVYRDVEHALGRVPSQIVALWLIGVSMFQRGCASVDFRRIGLVQGGRPRRVFPNRVRGSTEAGPTGARAADPLVGDKR